MLTSPSRSDWGWCALWYGWSEDEEIETLNTSSARTGNEEGLRDDKRVEKEGPFKSMEIVNRRGGWGETRAGSGKYFLFCFGEDICIGSDSGPSCLIRIATSRDFFRARQGYSFRTFEDK